MPFSVLIDVTKCIGCQGCQVACKGWNGMPADRTAMGGTIGNPSDMDSSAYTVMKFREGEGAKGPVWHFTKHQCMHCKSPACAAACPVGALTKETDGPVIYHKGRCIGCRYCMLACPFSVPKFEWKAALPYIQKCTFCSERIKAGMEPACTKTCPSGALLFGKSDDIMNTAKGRLASHPDKYLNHIYGADEAGGTSWLYISDTAFSELYLREDLEKFAYGRHAMDALGMAPAVGLGVAALLAGFYFISGRKERLNEKE